MNNSYATEPFCQTARESALPPGLTPYWNINRAEATAIFSFPSPCPRTDFQRLSSYQIPSSAISIPSNFIFFKSLCGEERYEAVFGAFKIHFPANVYNTGRGLFTFPKSFIIFNTAIFITVEAGIIVGPDRQSASDRIASPRRIRSDRAGIKVGPDCGPGRIMQV